ncbi:succinate receptor 1 [Archocentrus centrarchus]|uniref:succinate receptor 1 n=1 Tax=Archocentrus centrarchus TaxID=63155 RepID=UPI0011E9B49E|nr:succinate receptor 1 [Archocentrus centrarchus]
MAVLVLVVWLAAPADMDKHRGTGGFSGAKQPQGSANEVYRERLHLLTVTLRILTNSSFQNNYTMVPDCTDLAAVLSKYYLPTLYGIEFCVGFLGNLLVVLGYIFCLPKWQSCNIYLFNLAVSDVIFLSTLPRLCYLYSNDEQEYNPYICVINRYVLHVNLYSSILFMVWLSMDRFLLIKHPMRNHYLLRPKTGQIVTGLSWLAVNVEVAPMIALMVQDLRRGNWSHCRDFASLNGDVNVFAYSLGLTVMGYILPLLGLCFFSYQIAHLLHAQERALQRTTTSFKRPLRVAVSAAALFLVLYTPYHVLRNVAIASVQPWAKLENCTQMYIKSIYILTRPLAFLHSVINPVFYFLMGDKFRDLLQSKIRNLVRKTELQRDPS